jgi:hypothetical protein
VTVDQALARIMELVLVRPGDDILRRELRKILSEVRSAGYHQGHEDGIWEE